MFPPLTRIRVADRVGTQFAGPLGFAALDWEGGSRGCEGFCANPFSAQLVALPAWKGYAHGHSFFVHLPVGLMECDLHGSLHAVAARDLVCPSTCSFGHKPVHPCSNIAFQTVLAQSKLWVQCVSSKGCKALHVIVPGCLLVSKYFCSSHIMWQIRHALGPSAI